MDVLRLLSVRRIVLSVLGLYLLFAVIGRFVEGMGAVRCGCSPRCWCKRPVLSTFRWVFPYKHTADRDQAHPGPWPYDKPTTPVPD
jgi:hypothetical protein